MALHFLMLNDKDDCWEDDKYHLPDQATNMNLDNFIAYYVDTWIKDICCKKN